MNLQNILLYYVLPIGLAIGIGLILHWFSRSIASWLFPMSRLAQRIGETRQQTQERRETVIDLISGLISLTVFILSGVVILAQFVTLDTLVWMIGLFGAGFGFSARPFLSDYMTGITFVADDPFDVGEKVEINTIEGVVESITLRMTTLRGVSGEVYTIPNGEIRTVRNFSRGRFTPLKVTVRVDSHDLQRTVDLLESMADDALEQLPHLIERWQVVAENGTIGQHAELTIAVKAAFGKGAETRPRLLAFIQTCLNDADIPLVD